MIWDFELFASRRIEIVEDGGLLMDRKKIGLLALLGALLGIAIAVAQEEGQKAPAAQPGFKPTETIRADQGVAFPVDI
jgi:hypothetical protein